MGFFNFWSKPRVSALDIKIISLRTTQITIRTTLLTRMEKTSNPVMIFLHLKRKQETKACMRASAMNPRLGAQF